MDVTSLLNGNAVAAEQQKIGEKGEKRETSKPPSRNRTPWDAGGYSLPINTITPPSTTPPHTQNHHYEDVHSTPSSPRHKFSDSRSSLSSFTSSLQSTTHSRFSSMSTVSSTHQMGSLAESLAAGPKPLIVELEDTSSAEQAKLATYHQPTGSLSPTGSLDALALVAENRMASEQPSSKQNGDVTKVISMLEKESILEGRRTPSARPCSPSDAILIKRAAVPSLRVITGDSEWSGLGHTPPHNNFLSAPLDTHHQSLLYSRSHKRALSAPDFSYTMSESATSLGPKAEPTPPSSHHPDHASPTVGVSYGAPDTPPAAPEQVNGEFQSVVCMYIPNCDTGSQPRKAISHIFGRNKMCTRLIPPHVWVHYCRKHYQRSRYRNPKEYAKLQCDLVQQQIRRVHEWSLQNSKIGNAGGIVQDWGLAVRKREQKRLEDLGSNRKRNASNFEHESDDEENNRAGGSAVPATAVPSWLLALCGKGYTTQGILEVFNRLHNEILDDSIPCFPDIEILPNIVVDQDEPKSPKGYTKRVTHGHKRAQSLGVAMKSDYYAQDRRLSQPAVWAQDSSQFNTQKRRRPNEMGEMEAGQPQYPRSRMGSVEAPRRIQQLTHRPVFPGIDEHQRMEDEHYGYSQTYQQPLPAPTPQRFGSQSMAAHLEEANPMMRRPVHQRSYSDMGTIARAHPNYSTSQSSSYSPHVQHQSRPSPFQEQRGFQNGYVPAQQQTQWEQGATMSYQEPRQPGRLPSMGHTRNQSTPAAQMSYGASPMVGRRESLSGSYQHIGNSNVGYHMPAGAPSSSYGQPTGSVPQMNEPQVRGTYTSRR